MESASYLIFKMYFDTSGMKKSDLTRDWVEKLGKELAWYYISPNYGILGKCIIWLNAEIYCWESVMTISKPIWNERDMIPWNLRILVLLQTWARELRTTNDDS